MNVEVLMVLYFFPPVHKSTKQFGLSFDYDAPKIWTDLPYNIYSAFSDSSVRKKSEILSLYKRISTLGFFLYMSVFVDFLRFLVFCPKFLRVYLFLDIKGHKKLLESELCTESNSLAHIPSKGYQHSLT